MVRKKEFHNTLAAEVSENAQRGLELHSPRFVDERRVGENLRAWHGGHGTNADKKVGSDEQRSSHVPRRDGFW